MSKILGQSFYRAIASFLSEQGISLSYLDDKKQFTEDDYNYLCVMFFQVALGLCVEKKGELQMSQIGTLSVDKENGVMFTPCDEVNKFFKEHSNLLSDNKLLPVTVSDVIYEMNGSNRAVALLQGGNYVESEV